MPFQRENLIVVLNNFSKKNIFHKYDIEILSHRYCLKLNFRVKLLSQIQHIYIVLKSKLFNF